MYKRIKTSLFNHRFIAQFIADRMWVVALYFILFCTILTLPTFLSLSNATLYDKNESIELRNSLQKVNETATITNAKLECSESFYIETESYIYVFGDDAFNTDKLVFAYKEESVSVSYFGISINEMTYEELETSDTTISNNSTLSDTYSLVDMASAVTKGHLNTIKASISIISFIVNFFTYVVIAIALFVAGIFINPKIKGIFKMKVVIYSMTSIFLFDLITILSGFILFHYIGIIYSCVALFRALRAIVSIEVKRK